MAKYSACLISAGIEKEFESIADAIDWLANHPEVVVGNLVVVGGIVLVVTTGPGGALVLVAI